MDEPSTPPKDVDSTARAQLAVALAWFVPTLLILGSLAVWAGRALLGLTPLQSYLAGIGIVLGGALFYYVVMFKGVFEGAGWFFGQIYGGGSTEGRRQVPYSRAHAMSLQGAHEEALAILESAVLKDPEDPGPYLRAAMISFQELGNYKLAVEWYRRAQRAARMDPEMGAYVSMRLADIHESHGEAGSAMVELRRLVTLYPESKYVPLARRRLEHFKGEGHSSTGAQC